MVFERPVVELSTTRDGGREIFGTSKYRRNTSRRPVTSLIAEGTPLGPIVVIWVGEVGDNFGVLRFLDRLRQGLFLDCVF